MLRVAVELVLWPIEIHLRGYQRWSRRLVEPPVSGCLRVRPSTGWMVLSRHFSLHPPVENLLVDGLKFVDDRRLFASKSDFHVDDRSLFGHGWTKFRQRNNSLSTTGR